MILTLKELKCLNLSSAQKQTSQQEVSGEDLEMFGDFRVDSKKRSGGKPSVRLQL